MIGLDGIKDSLLAILDALLARRDYAAFYGATVAAQNDDGTLELKPTTTRLPPLSKVAIRYGIPGIRVKVKPGALVLVGFENQSPQSYYAILYGGASILSISFLEGTQGLARVGDALSFYLPEVIPFTGTISGLPAVGEITVLPSPAPGIIIGPGNPDVTA